jgi:taurine dioxygenase
LYCHRWQQGDLVIWDNRCTMHFAVSDYSADRYMHRATVIAEQPQRYVDATS